MNKMKLSIIIPVYNVEFFLEKCVESAICQEIENEEYEILLINDGSTDRSGEIAQKLAKKYSTDDSYSFINGVLAKIIVENGLK